MADSRRNSKSLDPLRTLREHLALGVTGCLSLRDKEGTEYRVYVMQGELLASQGPDDARWIVRRLVNNGALTETQGERFTARLANEERLDDLLFGQVPDELLLDVMAARFRQSLLDFLFVPAIPTFEPLEAIFVDNIQVGHDSHALLGELEARRDRIRGLRARAPGITVRQGSGRPRSLDEARLLDLCDEPARLADLVGSSPLEQGETLDHVFEMLNVGLLHAEGFFPTDDDEPTENSADEVGYDDEIDLSETSAEPWTEDEPTAMPAPSTPTQRIPESWATPLIDEAAVFGALGLNLDETPEPPPPPPLKVVQDLPQASPPVPKASEAARVPPPPRVPEPVKLPASRPAEPAKPATRKISEVVRPAPTRLADSFKPAAPRPVEPPAPPPKPVELPPVPAVDEAELARVAEEAQRLAAEEALRAEMERELTEAGSEDAAERVIPPGFDFFGADEDDSDALFVDHDRKIGRGAGEGTYTSSIKDVVELGPAAQSLRVDDDAIIETESLDSLSEEERANVRSVSFGAPPLEEDEIRYALDLVNGALREIARVLDEVSGPGSGRAFVQLLLEGTPAEFNALFRSVDARKDGRLAVESVLKNLRERPKTEHRQLVHRGVEDLIERALTLSCEDLDDEVADALTEAVLGYQKQLNL